MSNPLFAAVQAEKDPMFDVSIVTSQETECWMAPCANAHNNCHSVTKFFVASMIGMLEEEKCLSIFDPVTSFFGNDELPSNVDSMWHKISIQQCLQHKTGLDTIPYSVDNDADFCKIGNDFLKYIFSLPIEHQPGTYRRYSDEAYYLLGRIIEKASGLSTEEYLRSHIATPLQWRSWGMYKCPAGHPICGGGLFARADDMAKFAFVCAVGGDYNGHHYLNSTYIQDMMDKDYACSRFRDTDIWLKTGACGQCIAFSQLRPAGACWHGRSDMDGGKRNDRLLEAFDRYLDMKFGKV